MDQYSYKHLVCLSLWLLLQIQYSKAIRYEELNERLLTFNNFVTTFPIFDISYSVSFQIKPQSYLPVYRNVFYIYNLILGVWFDNSESGRLYVEASVSPSIFIKFYSVDRLPLNQWSSILISRFQNNGLYTFVIYLNGINIYNINAPTSQYSSNVKLYLSNDWDAPQDGFIKDFRLFDGNDIVLDVMDQLISNLITTLPSLNMKYIISFQVKPVVFLTQLKRRSLIHLTTGSNFMNTGDITPGIWLSNDGLNKLYISTIIGDSNKFFISKSLLQNDWSTVELILFQNNGIYDFLVALNKEVIHRVEKKTLLSFENVNVYAANLWDFNSESCIKNIQVNVQGYEVIQINPPWTFKQPNGVLINAETWQFVCVAMQKRQTSPCYQREISTGIVSFLPTQLMEVIGYDPITTLIYGLTTRNNYIAVDINKKTNLVISTEKCLRIKACNPLV